MGDTSVLQVIILREGTLVGSEVFTPGDYTVGSHPDCELVLADGSVSGCHAFISFRDGKVTIQEAGDFPLLVNGNAVAAADLLSRDDVGIGPFMLKCRVVGHRRGLAAVKPAPPATPNAALTPKPAPRAAPPPPAAIHPGPAAMPQTRSYGNQPKASAAPAHAPAPVARIAGPTAVPANVPAAKPAHRPTPVVVPSPAPVSPVSSGTPRFPETIERVLPQEPKPVAPTPASAKPTPSEGRELAPPDTSRPFMQARVFWGKSAVAIFGFPFGQSVCVGPSEKRDVPLYRMELPSKRFVLARCSKSGWTARVPQGLKAYRFEPTGWKAAEGTVKKNIMSVPMAPGQILRIGDQAYSVELRVAGPQPVPHLTPREFVASEAFFPIGLAMILGVVMAVGILLMPRAKETPDFNPVQLKAVRAVLKPPEKKKEEKKKEEKKEEKKEVAEKNADKPKKEVEVSKVKAAEVNKALKAVQKLTSVPAVESLLKATSKIAGGPKGYGDKGMGYKTSPLIGKPPIAMAGMGFGAGAGGFGANTKGLGAMRGLGGGNGGGIGAFAVGGTGKGKVGGTVVSAPSSGFKQRGGGGTLARDLIAKVINDHLGEVRGCYERALLKEAGLAGKLVLEWTIDTNGRVEEIKVKQASIKGAEVPNCIVSSLKTWIFPKPTGGKVIVSYPFLFNSVGF